MPAKRGSGGGGEGVSAWASRPAALLLAVMGCAAVAVGASQAGLLAPRDVAAPAPPWLRGVAIAVALLGAAALWLTRSRYPAKRTQRQGPAGRAIRTVALIMAALAWLTLFAPRPPTVEDGPTESEQQSAGSEVNPALPEMPGSIGDSPEPPRLSGAAVDEAEEFQPPEEPEPVEESPPVPEPPVADPFLGSWLWMLAALALVALVAFSRRYATAGAPAPTRSVELEEAEAGLLGSLAEVTRDSGDVRTQITLAYRHLLAALAEIGLEREPYQAPYEYLYSVLGPLGVRAEPLHELTQLYVLAQFSEHPLTPEHREAAVDALESSLAQLKSTRPPELELTLGGAR